MGRAGRVACIITPLALTIASLVCIILVGLGGTNKGNGVANQYYFMKTDTSKFNSTPNLDLTSTVNVDNQLLGQLFRSVNSTTKLKDFYTVSLWNYCDGSNTNGVLRIDNCGKPAAQYWFNPVQVWGLNNTGTTNNIPKTLQNALNTYKNASKWMFIAYVVAFFAIVVELIVGCFAIFSRWGSCVTTLVSGVATLFTLIASIMATAIYGSLVGSFNTVLKPYNVKGYLGHNMFSVTWLAVLFSFAAGLFWMFSSCCCSSRTNHSKAKPGKTHKYEQVNGHWAGQQQQYGQHRAPNVPMHNMDQGGHNKAYEPYRHAV